MKNLIILMVAFFLLTQCSTKKEETIIFAGSPKCYYDTFEGYNLSSGKWEEDTIKFFIEYYPSIDREIYKLEIIRAFELYGEHIGKKILEIKEPCTNYDIIIKGEKMDGVGGILGRSDFPPISKYSRYPVEIAFDIWDINTKIGRKKYDFFLSPPTR